MKNTSPLDPEAWLEEYGDYLFRFALQKVRNSALAEDLVQETLLSALVAKDRFTATATVRTWLTTILQNKIVDYWRRQGRETLVTDLMDGLDEDASVDDFFDHAGRWVDMPNAYPNPDKALENKQFWRIYETCLGKLKPRQAEVFLASEVQGMSGDDICAMCALSPANFWVLLHRARLALGKCLEIHWVK